MTERHANWTSLMPISGSVDHRLLYIPYLSHLALVVLIESEAEGSTYTDRRL